MKRLIFLIFISILHLNAFAEDIPLEVFAKHPKYKDMKVSPTGQYVAFTFDKPELNQVNLSVMERKSMKLISTFEFGEDRHIVNFIWLNNERIGMDVRKIIGWLDGVNSEPKWAAANADGTNRKILWDYQNSGLEIISYLESDPEHVLIGKRHWSEKGRIRLRMLNIYTGRSKKTSGLPKEARHVTPGIINAEVDLEEEVRFAYERDNGSDEVSDKDDKVFLHYKDTTKNWKRLLLDTKRNQPSITLLGVSADNQKFYFLSNHDQITSDSTGLFEFDFKSESTRLIFRHDDVDISGGIYASEGYLIGVRYNPGYPESFYIDSGKNKEEINYHKMLSGAFKGQVVSIRSRTSDKNIAMVSVRSDKNPGEFYFFDKEKNKLSYFASSKPEVINKKMARIEPFTMQARDGLKMYGLLTIPNNVEDKDLPMVVYPHGGPYGVSDSWRWDRRAQMLASRGYLVMQLNFRGSGGYGSDFRKAGHTEWGAKMQDDLTDATKWAIGVGIADPKRICIHGVSYGGYASMNAVVKEPDLYQCAIPDAGTYELELQWDKADSFSGRNSKFREAYINQSIGGYQNVKERSPVYHLDKLKAKLLIVHGGEDKRVPIDNSYILEEKLKEKDISYETLYKDEEGHGFTQVENRVELYQKILSFLEENIGAGAKAL